MNNSYSLQLLRLNQALALLGLSRSTFYKQVKQDLLPPPIHFGTRSVCWLKHELDTVLAGRVAGYNDKEIKKLVKDLVQQRTSFKSAHDFINKGQS